MLWWLTASYVNNFCFANGVCLRARRVTTSSHPRATLPTVACRIPRMRRAIPHPVLTPCRPRANFHLSGLLPGRVALTPRPIHHTLVFATTVHRPAVRLSPSLPRIGHIPPPTIQTMLSKHRSPPGTRVGHRAGSRRAHASTTGPRGRSRHGQEIVLEGGIGSSGIEIERLWDHRKEDSLTSTPGRHRYDPIGTDVDTSIEGEVATSGSV